MKLVLIASAVLFLSACAGVRKSDNLYSAHAENFNILFFQIPGGDTQKRAMEMVPEGADIETVVSSPTDLNSVVGVFNRIIGLDMTVISGEWEEPKD